jgi:putative flippase GtrA
MVGALGCALQTTAVWLLDRMGWPYPLATTAAVELAVLHNFAWHECWTWGDRGERHNPWRPTPRARLTPLLVRLFRFHLAVGLVSIAGNVVLTVALVERAGLTAPIANVAAVGVLSMLNYVAADRAVFQHDGGTRRPPKSGNTVPLTAPRA